MRSKLLAQTPRLRNNNGQPGTSTLIHTVQPREDLEHHQCIDSRLIPVWASDKNALHRAQAEQQCVDADLIFFTTKIKLV
eukprot:UN00559